MTKAQTCRIFLPLSAKAMQSAREMLADAIKSGKSEVAEAFVIRDAAGRALAVVPFLAVLPKCRKN